MKTLYKTMLNKVDAGILLVDSQLTIQMWNAWLEKYTGIGADRVVDKPLVDVIPVFAQPYYQQMFQNALDKGQGMFCSGAFHPLFVTPVSGDPGDQVKQNLQIESLQEKGERYIMLQITDTTNQYKRVQMLKEKIENEKKAKQALKVSEAKSMHLAQEAQEANDAKSRFIAHMSHEIRTPLNGVIGFAELLEDTELNPTQQQYLLHVKESGQALLDIVDDVLDVAKIEAEKLELDLQLIDVPALCQQALNMLAPQAAKKGLAIRLETGEEPMRAHALADPVRLKQILVNLLSNGVKFTHQGAVTLRLDYESWSEQVGRYTFTVSDTGIGISREEQKKLFQAFAQADGSITRKYGGTGLGLVISDRLAMLMGSRIDLTSEPGKGSSFTFVLEAHHEAEPATQKPPEKNRGSGLRQEWQPCDQPVRILVVDDVPLNLQLTTELIRQYYPKACVEGAYHGEEALEMMMDRPLDLVLMDIQMPVMDGMEATRRYRAYEQRKGVRGGASLPIIGVSAGASDEDRKHSKEAGMNGYLTKPLCRDGLLSSLEEHLLKKKPEQVATAPSTEETQLFSMKTLLHKMGNDQGSVEELAETTLGYVSWLMEEMDQVLAMGRYKAMCEQAHALKGTAYNMCLNLVGEQARELEHYLRQHPENQLGKAADHLSAINQAWEDTKTLLEGLLAGTFRESSRHQE